MESRKVYKPTLAREKNGPGERQTDDAIKKTQMESYFRLPTLKNKEKRENPTFALSKSSKAISFLSL